MIAPRFLTASDLARRYEVHRTTIWRWVRTGTLPRPVRLGPRPRWLAAAILDVERRAVQ